MIPLQSNLENVEAVFSQVNENLTAYQFSLGGNWDYQHGCFDRSLDEANKVWLRIPFQVISDVLDGEMENSQTKIRMGTPFVLKHVYNEGLDPAARFTTYGGLTNQFQDPVEKDADIEQRWISKASDLLRQVEKGFKTPLV